MPKRQIEIVSPPPVDAPPGLIVWVGPSNSGVIPVEAWREVLARRNLVWAGINKCGNAVEGEIRLALTATAVSEVAGVCRVDPARAFVAGFSGGAKVAAIAAMSWPDVFEGGALLIGGVAYWADIVVPEDEAILPALFDRPYLPGNVGAHSQQRYELIVGGEDQWRNPMLAVYKAMRDDGVFGAVTITQLFGLGHELPPGKTFDEALGRLIGGK